MKIKSDFIIAREAFPYLFFLAIIFILGLLFFIPATVPAAVLFVFVVFFFRNPNRLIIENENNVLSPADGKVMSVELVKGNGFFPDQRVWKVTIFLSLFNVHFNRVPLAGSVKKIEYVSGDFFPAFKSHAAENNERNYVLFDTDKGDILVAQITGFLARRIVCWEEVGNYLPQGARFGLIKFGSCTEIYLPTDFIIDIKQGDKVKGGITVIGRYPGD